MSSDPKRVLCCFIGYLDVAEFGMSGSRRILRVWFGPDFYAFWQAHLNDNNLDYCRGFYRTARGLVDDFTDRRFLQFVIRLAGVRRVSTSTSPRRCADGAFMSNGGIIKTGYPMLAQPVTIKFTDNVWLVNLSRCHVRLTADNIALL